MNNPFTKPAQNPDPLNRNIPYTEKNFEIGFVSSIIHTFILIFFAELGDKTFIMLFILQLRTNKVTIFYSAFFAEVLMNVMACFVGFLIEYLLYKNLIEYIGILFFFIYGIFLILYGFKTSEDTFEEEFEMIEEMHKQRMNRTPSMILGVDEEELNNDKIEKDKYNLDSVNKYNEKTYAPIIKKELTIIPESDISREDSIFNEEALKSGKKRDKKEDDEEESFILNKNSNNNGRFSLNLKKNRNSFIDSQNKNIEPEKKDIDTEINVAEGSYIAFEGNNEKDKENGEDQPAKLKGKPGMYRSRSRYCLDYLDKNVNVNQPNIDTSIFGTIFFSICLSEFGDRTQLISLMSSSIFHFWGSILGSCLALFFSCLIGVYFSKEAKNIFRQKALDLILGSMFLIYSIQIFIDKKRSQTAVV
jgi:putative Ca2+/H+ antiporter (TMEM165/GDT1 family)